VGVVGGSGGRGWMIRVGGREGLGDERWSMTMGRVHQPVRGVRSKWVVWGIVSEEVGSPCCFPSLRGLPCRSDPERPESLETWGRFEN